MRTLTPRIVCELATSEAIVLEEYLDSVGVRTWSVGVTDASGHKTARYRDHPSSLREALDVYIWLLKTRYLPSVLEAFAGRDLTENELGAALSFHYNTGAIKRASWPKLVLAGNLGQARAKMLEYRFPPEILPRRRREAALFFDGTWAADGEILLYTGVSPAGRHPIKPKRADIKDIVAQILGGS